MVKSRKTLLAFIFIFVILECLIASLAIYETVFVNGTIVLSGVLLFKISLATIFVLLSLFFIYKSKMSTLKLQEQIEKSFCMSENLRAINRNLYGVLNSINAIVFVSDHLNHEIIYANNYAISKFGEIIGKSSYNLTKNDDAEFLEKGYNSYEHYSEITREWYAVTEKISSWMDGRSVKISICLNITDRKIAEEKLKEINEHLEERVDDAVSELRKKDQLLIQQSKMAAMGEMIGAIAHQWRQPLNALGLIVQDFKISYQLEDLNAEYIDKITHEAMEQIRYMSKTIDDFRNFFRPDKPKAVFTIQNAILDALKIVSSQLTVAKIQVKTKFDERPMLVDGYENEFKQVVLNLITNAKDAILEKRGDDGTGVISIGVYKEGNKAILTVADNGGGIKESVFGRIFEPYFTTKDQSKGTGIGLYMSKMIIEDNMNGLIFASNIDGGAEFHVELGMIDGGDSNV